MKQSLKHKIRRGLKKDRDTWLDQVITEIKQEMSKDVQAGYRLLLQ